MTENMQPDVVIQHDVENTAIQPVYAGDTILDRHINDLQDAIKKIQDILGETTKEELKKAINNFSDLTAQINDLHNSLISEGNSNIIKGNDNGKQYLTTQKASTEKEGVVKFSSNIDNGGEDLVVSAAQFNNKFEELNNILTNDYVPLDSNSKISQKYFPDNLLSDRVFGGVITASKISGAENITFNPEINIKNSTLNGETIINKSIYNFQIVTDGSEVEGKLPVLDEGHSWEEDNESIVTISSGDWIYSYYDSDNGRKYRIIKNLDDITILGPNNITVQKDNLHRYDLSPLFSNLKEELEKKIENVKNTLRNELKGELENTTKYISRYCKGHMDYQFKDFPHGKVGRYTSYGQATIIIPLPKDITTKIEDLKEIKKIAFYGTQKDIFYLEEIGESVTSKNIDSNGLNTKSNSPWILVQGKYYHTGNRIDTGGSYYSTDSGWEYNSSTDFYAGGFIIDSYDIEIYSAGLYWNKDNNQCEIILDVRGLGSSYTNPTSWTQRFDYEIWF